MHHYTNHLHHAKNLLKKIQNKHDMRDYKGYNLKQPHNRDYVNVYP